MSSAWKCKCGRSLSPSPENHDAGRQTFKVIGFSPIQVVDMLRRSPLIISFFVILLPLLEPLLCLDLVFDFFHYISNPIKTLLAINRIVFSALPGVVFVVGRYGTLGIDIYRLAILLNM